MEGTGLPGVVKNTPVVEVIRRAMLAEGKPVTVSHLTERLRDAWGRNLTSNPYDDYCLVYKLATMHLNCQVSCENLVNNRMPVVQRINPEHEPVQITPGMRFEGMNQKTEEIGQLVLSLPE